MFNKLFRRNSTAVMRETEQHQIDCLRYHNADNQMMQLHLDRMQTSLKSR